MKTADQSGYSIQKQHKKLMHEITGKKISMARKTTKVSKTL